MHDYQHSYGGPPATTGTGQPLQQQQPDDVEEAAGSGMMVSPVKGGGGSAATGLASSPSPPSSQQSKRQVGMLFGLIVVLACLVVPCAHSHLIRTRHPTTTHARTQRRSGLVPAAASSFTEAAAAGAAALHVLPSATELRVQGVGDIVEGSIALQQRGQPAGQQQWSLDGLGAWRQRAFGATAEGQETLRQQQREMRLALLRGQPPHGSAPTAMVSSPVNAGAALGGAARRKGEARALAFGQRETRGAVTGEEEQMALSSQEEGGCNGSGVAWLPGHG